MGGKQGRGNNRKELRTYRQQVCHFPEVELSAQSWGEAFDENNSIGTPIGRVKMGDNQITKFFAKGREKSFGMVTPTLSDPDVIVEKEAQSPNAERDTKYIFIKTFIKPDGSRYVHFESVTVQKDGMEVSISSHEVDRKVVKKEMQNGKILHLNNQLSLGSERYLTETQNEGRPNLVPTSDNNTSNLARRHADNVSAASDIADGLYSSQENMSDPTTECTDAPQTNYSDSKGSEKPQKTNELGEKVAVAEAETATNPTEGQFDDVAPVSTATKYESDIQPIGHGAFGDIYDQFKGKAQEVILFLSEKQDGEAIGALHHKDVGDISLVWGNNKAGLKKILVKHPEVTNDIQRILDEMSIVEESDNCIKL